MEHLYAWKSKISGISNWTLNNTVCFHFCFIFLFLFQCKICAPLKHCSRLWRLYFNLDRKQWNEEAFLLSPAFLSVVFSFSGCLFYYVVALGCRLSCDCLCGLLLALQKQILAKCRAVGKNINTPEQKSRKKENILHCSL